MKTFNVTLTKLKVYEAVVEAESKGKVIDTIKCLKRTKDDWVDKGIIINEISEININKEQIGPVGPVSPVGPIGPVLPVGPDGNVNAGIGGNVGPTRLGSNAPADIKSSGLNLFESFSFLFDIYIPPFSLRFIRSKTFTYYKILSWNFYILIKK